MPDDIKPPEENINSTTPIHVNHMGRSTIEAYIGISIAIITGVFPMTWQLRCALLFILVGLVVDVSLRHPRMIARHLLFRVTVALIVITIIIGMAWAPVREEYKKESKSETIREGPVQDPDISANKHNSENQKSTRHSVPLQKPMARNTVASQNPVNTNQNVVPGSTVNDIHEQLANGRLSDGWTLHKQDDKWSIYFIVNTSSLNDLMKKAMDQPNIVLDSDLEKKAISLWQEIHLTVPALKPIETEYGIVKDQKFVEHISYQKSKPKTVLWTYEVFANGSNITPNPQIHTDLEIDKLSSNSRATIKEFDAMAVRNVNKRYIDAMIKISQ